MDLYRQVMARAQQLAEEGDRADAVAAYQEAARLAPDRPDAHYELGLLHHKLGQAAEAIACFERSAELAPQDATVLNNLGVLYYRKGLWERAVDSLNRAVSIDAHYVDAWDSLTKAYEKLIRVLSSRQPNYEPKATCVATHEVREETLHARCESAGVAMPPVDRARIARLADSHVPHLAQFYQMSPAEVAARVSVGEGPLNEEWAKLKPRGARIRQFYETIADYPFSLSAFTTERRLTYLIEIHNTCLFPGARFLDFGAGLGDLGFYYAEQMQVSLLDVQGTTQEFCRFRSRQLGLDVRFLNDLAEQDHFDVISAQDVLEHLDRPYDTVREMGRALRWGGRLVTSGFWFNTSNPLHLRANAIYRETFVGDFAEQFDLWLDRIYHGSNFVIAVFKKLPQAGIKVSVRGLETRVQPCASHFINSVGYAQYRCANGSLAHIRGFNLVKAATLPGGPHSHRYSAKEEILARAARLAEAGDQAGAAAAYREAIALAPERPDAYYELGLLHHKLGELAEAIACFERAAELAPEDASVWNNLGVLYYGRGELAKAERAFRQALSLDQRYGDAWCGLARALLDEGREAEAAQALHNCLRWEPQHSKAQTALTGLGCKAPTPKVSGLRIGFVSLWFERGQAYVTKMLRDALSQEHQTFVLARSGGTAQRPLLATTGEWAVPNLTTWHEYTIPHDVMRRWLTENRLDLVVFNEEYDLGLVWLARTAGARTVGCYYWELFNPGLVSQCNVLYNKIICPTDACYQKFQSLGMHNLVRVRWAVDSTIFKPRERVPLNYGVHEPNEHVRFFHPAGWGGIHARRGTQFVIDAFLRAGLSNAEGAGTFSAELLIHTQQGKGKQQKGNITILRGTVPRDELVRLYQGADVAVLPSKWEGLGLTFLEAIGCGLPIITVDAPPMNEFVRDGETGFLCKVAERQRYQGIFVEGVHVDLDDMAEKMRALADAQVREAMAEPIRALGSELSWERFAAEVNRLVGGRTAGHRTLARAISALCHDIGDLQALRLFSSLFADDVQAAEHFPVLEKVLKENDSSFGPFLERLSTCTEVDRNVARSLLARITSSFPTRLEPAEALVTFLIRDEHADMAGTSQEEHAVRAVSGD